MAYMVRHGKLCMKTQNISRLKYVHAHVCVCVLCVWMPYHTRRYARIRSNTYLNEGRGQAIGSMGAGLCYTSPRYLLCVPVCVCVCGGGSGDEFEKCIVVMSVSPRTRYTGSSALVALVVAEVSCVVMHLPFLLLPANVCVYDFEYICVLTHTLAS